MYVGKAWSLAKSEAPERYFSRVDSSLALKKLTRMERLARDKRSSLLAHQAQL
jgi:hypothetical protein